MNKRIDELIAKSRLENLDGFSQYEVDNIYHLAELIVRECMDKCFTEDGERIRKHFGVE